MKTLNITSRTLSESVSANQVTQLRATRTFEDQGDLNGDNKPDIVKMTFADGMIQVEVTFNEISSNPNFRTPLLLGSFSSGAWKPLADDLTGSHAFKLMEPVGVEIKDTDHDDINDVIIKLLSVSSNTHGFSSYTLSTTIYNGTQIQMTLDDVNSLKVGDKNGTRTDAGNH